MAKEAVVIERGEGIWLWDEQGNRYLDGSGALWYANVGHGRGEIADAVAAQLRKLEAYSIFGDMAVRPALDLAERLATLAPMDGGRVFFGSGGGAATETATKLARGLRELREDQAPTQYLGSLQPGPGEEELSVVSALATRTLPLVHVLRIQRLGAPEPKEWEDLLNPKLKGEVAQCAPTRSSSSNATYEVMLSLLGEEKGWEWLTRLASNTGHFTSRSRDVPTVVAKGEFAAGFAVPSYMAFEERLAGFDIKFVAPRNAFVTPEPMAVGTRFSRSMMRVRMSFLLSMSFCLARTSSSSSMASTLSLLLRSKMTWGGLRKSEK